MLRKNRNVVINDLRSYKEMQKNYVHKQWSSNGNVQKLERD